MKSSTPLVNEMLSHHAQMLKEVADNREEILRAFTAKWGFDPDECEQVHSGNSWAVVRLAPDKISRIQREVILARLTRKTFTPWQEFCLWLAGVRK